MNFCWIIFLVRATDLFPKVSLTLQISSSVTSCSKLNLHKRREVEKQEVPVKLYSLLLHCG